MTSEQYRESIRDGRVTYLDGELITELEDDPRLKLSVDHVAAGYDKYYDPTPGAINPVMSPPRSAQELRERIPMWQGVDFLTDTTYQTSMTLFTAAPKVGDRDPVYVDRIKAYVHETLTSDIRVSECITDAKGNRTLAPSKQNDPDAYVRVVSRSADGVVIRGAKMHISGASMGHHLMVIPTKTMKPGDEDYAIACAVPVNAPGVSIVNVGFIPRGADLRHHPASTQVALYDGMVIFDDVFVPHEHVFLDGHADLAGVFAHSLGLWERLGGICMMLDYADEMVGFATLIAEANGLSKVSHIREKIDEMAIHSTLIRAGLEAAVANAGSTPDGYYYPDELFINAAKYRAASDYQLMVRHLHDIAGGSVITTPTMADFDREDVGPLLHKYFSTGDEIPGEYRARLFHAIRDITADTYGGWRAVAGLQSGGGLFAQRLLTRKHYDFERAKRMARHAARIPEPATGDHG